MSSSACELLNLGENELEALHGRALRVLGLGAEVVVVRARNREVIALAERAGTESPARGDAVITRRLRRADLGVLSRAEIDLTALAAEAHAMDAIIESAVNARWER